MWASSFAMGRSRHEQSLSRFWTLWKLQRRKELAILIQFPNCSHTAQQLKVLPRSNWENHLKKRLAIHQLKRALRNLEKQVAHEQREYELLLRSGSTIELPDMQWKKNESTYPKAMGSD